MRNAMKELKIRKGNTTTKKGFNFNYTLYMRLKSDWYNHDAGNEYNKSYVSESGQVALTLGHLKKMEEIG